MIPTYRSGVLEASGPGRIELMKEGGTDRCHVAIRVFDFDEAVAMLKANGIELEEPKIGADFKAVFLRRPDPAGNRIHLLWRRPRFRQIGQGVREHKAPPALR